MEQRTCRRCGRRRRVFGQLGGGGRGRRVRPACARDAPAFLGGGVIFVLFSSRRDRSSRTSPRPQPDSTNRKLDCELLFGSAFEYYSFDSKLSPQELSRNAFLVISPPFRSPHSPAWSPVPHLTSTVDDYTRTSRLLLERSTDGCFIITATTVLGTLPASPFLISTELALQFAKTECRRDVASGALVFSLPSRHSPLMSIVRHSRQFAGPKQVRAPAPSSLDLQPDTEDS